MRNVLTVISIVVSLLINMSLVQELQAPSESQELQAPKVETSQELQAPSPKHIKEVNEDKAREIAINESIEPEAVEVDTYYTKDLKTDAELQEYATRFLRAVYGLDMDIPVYFVDSIESNEGHINGQFWYTEDHATRIIINRERVDDNDSHAIERTLRHELTHYALYTLGFDSDDNTRVFEAHNYINGGTQNGSSAEPNFLESNIEATCCD